MKYENVSQNNACHYSLECHVLEDPGPSCYPKSQVEVTYFNVTSFMHMREQVYFLCFGQHLAQSRD
jgi:hypothetical protein